MTPLEWALAGLAALLVLWALPILGVILLAAGAWANDRRAQHNPKASPCRCMTCHANEAVRFFGDLGMSPQQRAAEVMRLSNIPVRGEDNVIYLPPRGGVR